MKQQQIDSLLSRIRNACERVDEIRLMEVCGTHTVSLFRSGVKSMLPENLRLISGPGCPVCVTAQGYIDAACELAQTEGVVVATYGDMIRVPGGNGSLSDLRAEGGRVKVVYSTIDALEYAKAHPEMDVVFLAVGFETTAPATAAAIVQAKKHGVSNFHVLPGHKLVIPAMKALLSAGDVPIDGFICPGHVSVVIGSDAYLPIAGGYGKPCVVTGFEPQQMLLGIAMLAEQVNQGLAEVENAYGVAVTTEGNTKAWELIMNVFRPGPAVWRAMGSIDDSGLSPKDDFKEYDAAEKYGLSLDDDYSNPGCLCGDVIQGKAQPAECGLFAGACTPTTPIGPCMVSSEGTCAAWYKYGRHTT